jgi:hypothetical protein
MVAMPLTTPASTRPGKEGVHGIPQTTRSLVRPRLSDLDDRSAFVADECKLLPRQGYTACGVEYRRPLHRRPFFLSSFIHSSTNHLMAARKSPFACLVLVAAATSLLHLAAAQVDRQVDNDQQLYQAIIDQTVTSVGLRQVRSLRVCLRVCVSAVCGARATLRPPHMMDAWLIGLPPTPTSPQASVGRWHAPLPWPARPKRLPVMSDHY